MHDPSPWLPRKDADRWIDTRCDSAVDLIATTVHIHLARTVIDNDRDPSVASLHSGQAATELCSTTTFDDEALNRPSADTRPAKVAERRMRFVDPDHAALREEVIRLPERHARIVVYEGHSIINGFFKGGLITRSLVRPAKGVRGYMAETPGPGAAKSWPVPYDKAVGVSIRVVPADVLVAMRDFAERSPA